MGKVDHSIWTDYLYLKQVYPELYMCRIEVKPPRIATGTVILPEFRSMPREVKALFSFPIKVVYPDDFPNHAIRVFDAEERIDFNVIPPEHQHTLGELGLCTHHPYALKLVRNKENQSLLIIRSAILLYLAYLDCLKTGKWPAKFKGLPHGEAGERQAKRDLEKGMKYWRSW